MPRYAAKLLFQFRVRIGPKGEKRDNQRRLCEERIIVLLARSAREALSEAKRRGKESRHSYLNSAGNRVIFEFVGVMELLDLMACESDEVWYDIVKRLRPSERNSEIIPPEARLHAFRMEAERAPPT